MNRQLQHLYSTLALGVTMLALVCNTATAQQPEVQGMQQGELFLQGYLTIKDAKKLEDSNQYIRAWEGYRKALSNYQSIAAAYPAWRRDLVQRRINLTKADISRVEPLAQQQLAINKAKIPALILEEDPVKQASKATASRYHKLNNKIDSVQNKLKLTKNKHQIETAELQQEVKQLELELSKTKQYTGKETAQTRSLNSAINRLKEQMDRAKQADGISQGKLAATLKELERQRALLAAAPLQQDVDNLQAERDNLEQELILVVKEHKRTIAELNAVKQENKTLMTDVLYQKKLMEKIQENLTTEREANNAITEGLKSERDKLYTQLDQANQTIIAQSNKISSLENQLTQLTNVNSDLRNELAIVTQERDQMSELLSMDKSERVQQLITDNVRIASELKDAKTNLQRTLNAKNIDQDEVIRLRNELDQSQINYLALKRENINYKKRISSVEQLLADTELELQSTASSPDADKVLLAEVETLKQTVNRLLTAQAIRRDQEELLWKTYDRKFDSDPEMNKIFTDLSNNNIRLTEEEKQLLSKRDADETFQFKNYASKSERFNAKTRLESQLASYQNLAKRFLERGNLSSARDVFDQARELHPGDYATLMNCGVVRYAMGDFSSAAECFAKGIGTTHENNAYTHYMLGSCQYRIRQAELAAKSFERAIVIQPDYANAHLHLGIIRGEGGRYEQAIESFQTAIDLDPELNQAHYNLSEAYFSQGNYPQAQDAYLTALKKGFPPNPSHELKIKLNQ